MPYWLMKSEPDEFGIDDLAAAPGKTTAWFGVRNYQARNFMRDQMRLGDKAFFYHSSCPEPGIAGIAQVSSDAYPDASQFDAKSPYFDPAAKRESPRWFNVEVKFVRKTRLVTLAELRNHEELAAMRTLAPGNRLSITPVTPKEWAFITKRLMGLRRG
jgi:predicted RNA-binding protein with PUA-like domain